MNQSLQLALERLVVACTLYVKVKTEEQIDRNQRAGLRI